MDTFCIKYQEIPVFDNDFFTKARGKEWKNYFVTCYSSSLKHIKQKMDSSCMVEFFIDYALLREVIVDAIIGMKKIVSSNNNYVEKPNAFKIAAYLSYWWLRHKPVSIHYPRGYDINKELHTTDGKKETAQKLTWQLKHINELIAVEFVITFIFDLKNRVCTETQCKYLIDRESDKFVFSDFNEMQKVLMEKLTYYFCYRAIAPKVIEHILEGYTIHPIWSLTGAHWKVDDKSE